MVTCTRVIGLGRCARSIGIMPTSGDHPTDVLLQVSFLYQPFDLVTKLKAFSCVMASVLVEFTVFSHVPPFH